MQEASPNSKILSNSLVTCQIDESEGFWSGSCRCKSLREAIDKVCFWAITKSPVGRREAADGRWRQISSSITAHSTGLLAQREHVCDRR